MGVLGPAHLAGGRHDWLNILCQREMCYVIQTGLNMLDVQFVKAQMTLGDTI
uniref:Uncharacterized protein n=1 Tax=Aegilops tauschii TaxID=37682 RepID=M8BJ15_AEGTA